MAAKQKVKVNPVDEVEYAKKMKEWQESVRDNDIRTIIWEETNRRAQWLGKRSGRYVSR